MLWRRGERRVAGVLAVISPPSLFTRRSRDERRPDTRPRRRISRSHDGARQKNYDETSVPAPRCSRVYAGAETLTRICRRRDAHTCRTASRRSRVYDGVASPCSRRCRARHRARARSRAACRTARARPRRPNSPARRFRRASRRRRRARRRARGATSPRGGARRRNNPTTTRHHHRRTTRAVVTSRWSLFKR